MSPARGPRATRSAPPARAPSPRRPPGRRARARGRGDLRARGRAASSRRRGPAGGARRDEQEREPEREEHERLRPRPGKHAADRRAGPEQAHRPDRRPQHLRPPRPASAPLRPRARRPKGTSCAGGTAATRAARFPAWGNPFARSAVRASRRARRSPARCGRERPPERASGVAALGAGDERRTRDVARGVLGGSAFAGRVRPRRLTDGATEQGGGGGRAPRGGVRVVAARRSGRRSGPRRASTGSGGGRARGRRLARARADAGRAGAARRPDLPAARGRGRGGREDPGGAPGEAHARARSRTSTTRRRGRSSARSTATRVFVLGEVTRPGGFPLRGPMSVMQAIAVAGGRTEFAKDEVVWLRQETGRKDRAGLPVVPRPGEGGGGGCALAEARRRAVRAVGRRESARRRRAMGAWRRFGTAVVVAALLRATPAAAGTVMEPIARLSLEGGYDSNALYDGRSADATGRIAPEVGLRLHAPLWDLQDDVRRRARLLRAARAGRELEPPRARSRSTRARRGGPCSPGRLRLVPGLRPGGARAGGRVPDGAAARARRRRARARLDGRADQLVDAALTLNERTVLFEDGTGGAMHAPARRGALAAWAGGSRLGAAYGLGVFQSYFPAPRSGRARPLARAADAGALARGAARHGRGVGRAGALATRAAAPRWCRRRCRGARRDARLRSARERGARPRHRRDGAAGARGLGGARARAPLRAPLVRAGRRRASGVPGRCRRARTP